jgi:ribosomal-protein-serine acetyltransferase
MEPETAFVPRIIPAAPGIELRPVTVGDSAALFQMIESNLPRLFQWLMWARPDFSEPDLYSFLAERELENTSRKALTTAICVDGVICGSVAMHQIDWLRKSTSIGYWLDAGHGGRGVATHACRALVREAFTEYGLHRVEIRCAAGNDQSAAIPLRLGFREEAVLREAEQLHGKFVDLRLFSMLSHHWEGGYGRV